MSSCTPKILVQGPHFSIAICSGCQRLGFNYNNVLAGFDKAEFNQFARGILSRNFSDFATPFPPQGQLKAVVNTSNTHLQMAFSETEFYELKDILQQSLLMLDTAEILNA